MAIKTKVQLSSQLASAFYGEPVAKVIKKIISGNIPPAKELREALKSGAINIIDGHTKEKELFIEFLEKEAIEKHSALTYLESSGASPIDLAYARKAAETADIEVDKFSRSFENNSPLTWTDVEKFAKYFNDEKKYQIGHKSASIGTLNYKLLEKWYPYKNEEIKREQIRILRKLQVLSSKVDKLTDQELKKLGFGEKVSPTLEDLPLLIELASADKNLDISVTSDIITGLEVGEGTVTVELELSSQNKYKGQFTNLIRTKINSLFNKYTKKTASELEDLLKDIDIANVKFSPSFANKIENSITYSILNKKLKTKRDKAIRKAQHKIKGEKNKVKAAIAKSARKKVRIPEIISQESLPLFNILSIINESLAEQIKQNMGRSTDAAILLRNQTGRFSESAKLLTLTRSTAGILLGTYTYQRNPYDVFLPGGRLHTQKRDPRLYVEGSIRELSLSILKNKFPGLELELV